MKNKDMKISTNFGPYIKRNDLETTLKKIAQVGFKAVDFSLSRTYGVGEDDEKIFYGKIKSLCADLDLELFQGHSPFERTDLSPEYFLGDEYFNLQKSAVKRASYLGIPYLVVHPFTHSAEEGCANVYDDDKKKQASDVNLTFYKRLKYVFEDYGVKCAIENLAEYDYVRGKHCACFGSSSAELKNIISELGRDTFCACFDSGHANLVKGETLSDFILNLGEDIKCVHLHDNFGEVSGWGSGLDRHLPPFYGNIKWKELKNSLIEAGYDGTLNLECSNYMPNAEFDDYFAKYIFKAAKFILSD